MYGRASLPGVSKTSLAYGEWASAAEVNILFF